MYVQQVVDELLVVKKDFSQPESYILVG